MAQNENRLPEYLDGCAKLYVYDSVPLEKTPRESAAYCSTGKVVTFQVEDGAVLAFQNEHNIGQLTDEKLVRRFRDWEETGEPVVGILTAYAWRGVPAKITVAFYRNLLEHLRKKPGAVIARIGKPSVWLDEEDDIGKPMTVSLDPQTGRYVLEMDGADAGLLPIPVVDQIHANCLEPEDASYYLDHCHYDEDVGRLDWYVLIV